MSTRIEWNHNRIKRFWSRVDKTNGCWLWTGWTDRDGYGSFRIPNGHSRAHRASFELTKGPIPKGMCILHSCDNRRCVNPDHLSIGTNKENIYDRHLKGRDAKGIQHGTRTFPGRCIRIGTKNGNAKLSESSVLQMKKLREMGLLLREIASAYNVSISTVGKAVSGYQWKHVGSSGRLLDGREWMEFPE